MSFADSEGPRVRSDHCVIGKRRVTMRVVHDVAGGNLAIALHRPGRAHVDDASTARIGKAGLDRDHVTRPAKSVARSEGIAHRDTLHAPTDAQCRPADLWHIVGKAAAPQVLVGRRNDVFSWRTSKGLDSGSVLRAEEPSTSEIADG